MREQLGWWLGYNSVTRSGRRAGPSSLVVGSMIVIEVGGLLGGPRMLGYVDAEADQEGGAAATAASPDVHPGLATPVFLSIDPPHHLSAACAHLHRLLPPLVAMEGSDGRYILDFLLSLWPFSWLPEEDHDQEEDESTSLGGGGEYSLTIFSPFGLAATQRLLALSRFLGQNGFGAAGREYEVIQVEKMIAGHTLMEREGAKNVWRFERGKGLTIGRRYTVRLLAGCWVPPLAVIVLLCVLHLRHPDEGLGDILSLVGAALSALAAWIPGTLLDGWQLADAVRGRYYTTNLDIAQSLSTSLPLRLVSYSLRRRHPPAIRQLEPASLVIDAVQRGDAAVVGNGRCYFRLQQQQQQLSPSSSDTSASFSPLEIVCNSGVPLGLLVLEPVGKLRIPIPRQGRGTTQAYISRGGHTGICEIRRTSEATVHLEEPWVPTLSRLQILLSSRRSSYRPYQTNGQLGKLLLPPSPKQSKFSFSHGLTGSYQQDLDLLIRVLRGGKNLLVGGYDIQETV